MSNMESWSMYSLFKLSGHSDGSNSVVFSPNGEYLASGFEDNTIRVSSGERIKTLKGYSSKVYSVLFSPNGEYLVYGSTDRYI